MARKTPPSQESHPRITVRGHKLIIPDTSANSRALQHLERRRNKGAEEDDVESFQGAALDPNIASADDLLHEYIKEGREDDAIKVLLDQHAALKASDEKNNNALHLSIHYGMMEMLFICLSTLARRQGLKPYTGEKVVEITEPLIDAQNNKGRTPLLKAMKWGDLSMVAALLYYNADPNIKDARGEGISDYIEHFPAEKYEGLKKVLVEHGAYFPQGPHLNEEELKALTGKQRRSYEAAYLKGRNTPVKEKDSGPGHNPSR